MKSSTVLDISVSILGIALDNTVPEINLNSLGPLHLGTVEKSLFSMVTPEVDAALKQHNFKSVIVLGIEVRVYNASIVVQNWFETCA